jgi:GntR family transcriptional regulator of arabinose operon
MSKNVLIKKQLDFAKTSGAVKHRSIFESLQSSIVDGKFRVGEKLPTEDELVKRFGVSRTTISRAMRDLQHAGLLERRRGAGSFVVGSPRDNATGLVGIVIAMQLGPHSIFGTIAQPIENAAARRGWKTMMAQNAHASKWPEQNAEELVENLERLKMLGVVFAPGSYSSYEDRFNHHFTEACDSAGIAVVLLDRDIEPFPNRSKYDLVNMDNLLASYSIANHLIEAGAKKILFALEKTSCTTTDARLAGRDLAGRRGGLHLDDNLTIRFEQPNVSEIVQRVLQVKPDAVMCECDHTAARLLKEFSSSTLRVPQDVMLTGFDDNILATMLTPAITTYRQPMDAIGIEAIRLLESRLADPLQPPRHSQIPGKLVVRESTTG